MPTFHFYRNKVKIDSFSGASVAKLEETIQRLKGDDADAGGDTGQTYVSRGVPWHRGAGPLM